MHPAVAAQAEDVQTSLGAVLHGPAQGRVFADIAAGDQLIDARDLHLDDAPGADIEMADLAVAHLPFGQADERPIGADERVRVLFPKAIEIGLAGHGDGVVGGIGVVSPAVHDGQH
jgi:hypothetical protein